MRLMGEREREIDETDGRERVIGFLQNSSIFAMSISIILKLLFFLNVINLTNIECFNSRRMFQFNA